MAMKIWCFPLSTNPNNQSIKTESGWGSLSLNYMYVLQWVSATPNKNRKLIRLFEVYIADVSLLTSNRFVGLFWRERRYWILGPDVRKCFLKMGSFGANRKHYYYCRKKFFYNQLILQFFQDFDCNFWHIWETFWHCGRPWVSRCFLLENTM